MVRKQITNRVKGAEKTKRVSKRATVGASESRFPAFTTTKIQEEFFKIYLNQRV